MEEDPNDGFQKLNFLLGHPPFPPETFGNLLLLHCKYGYYELAADILAENAHLTFMFLPQVNWSSSSRACMAITVLVLLLLLHPFLFSCHLFVYFWPSSMHQPNFNMFSFLAMPFRTVDGGATGLVRVFRRVDHGANLTGRSLPQVSTTAQIQVKYEMKAAQHTHTKRMIHAWNAVLCALSCQNQIFCLVLALYFVHSLFLLVVILLPLYEGTTS